MLAALRSAFVSHLDTARLAVPLLPRRTGLIVEITEGDTLLHGGMSVIGTLVKTMQKVAAYVLAEELRKKQIAVIAVTPGFLRSESMLERFKVTEDSWQEAGKKDKYFLHSETPLFLGRGIAALAADPDVLSQAGTLTSSWALARRYGIRDRDGTRPDWGVQVPVALEEYGWFRRLLDSESRWLHELADRVDGYRGGRP
jgi:NAD(P)-dependent dehydrogenase (short-subunit alcohol dehydrogenase family)